MRHTAASRRIRATPAPPHRRAWGRVRFRVRARTRAGPRVRVRVRVRDRVTVAVRRGRACPARA